MSNNYARGADFERRVKADLEGHEYWVIRAAGSHGIVDLIAFGGLEPWAIQCKTDGKMGPADRRELYDKCVTFSAVPIKASKVKGGKIRYQRLLVLGYKEVWDEVKP